MVTSDFGHRGKKWFRYFVINSFSATSGTGPRSPVQVETSWDRADRACPGTQLSSLGGRRVGDSDCHPVKVFSAFNERSWASNEWRTSLSLQDKTMLKRTASLVNQESISRISECTRPFHHRFQSPDHGITIQLVIQLVIAVLFPVTMRVGCME